MNTEYFVKKLEEEKMKLESEMASIGRTNPLVPGDWEAIPVETGVEPDSIDQASDITQNEDSSAVFADLEARYDTVLLSLQSIEKGTYGVCEVCGCQIEEDRLIANPTATTCVLHL